VKEKQDIVVNLKASTKEDILNAIKSNKLDGIKIEIEKPVTYIMEYSMADTTTIDTSKQKMQMQIFEMPCNSVNTAQQISQL
jgi:glycerol-3-phosphate O-acyltransferase